jgi:hypothetical protein
VDLFKIRIQPSRRSAEQAGEDALIFHRKHESTPLIITKKQFAIGPDYPDRILSFPRDCRTGPNMYVTSAVPSGETFSTTKAPHNRLALFHNPVQTPTNF